MTIELDFLLFYCRKFVIWEAPIKAFSTITVPLTVRASVPLTGASVPLTGLFQLSVEGLPLKLSRFRGAAKNIGPQLAFSTSAGSKPVRIRTYLHERPQKTKTDMYKFAPRSLRL